MKIRSLILACIFFISLNGYAIGNPEIENLLSAFSAKVKKGEVSLSWKVSNPKNLNKFKLECKKSSEGAFVKVDDILFSDYLKKETKGEETIYSFSYKDTKNENGVYFYRLSSGSFTDVKKMMLVK